jgi:indolepyruvate ferredoxin oxidoreductase
MAYKDEYEVARLHADGQFMKKIDGMFEGEYRVNFHLSPPLFARIDPNTGEPRKTRFGAWIMPAFRALARLKWLRGTALDVFGHTEERRTERALIREYEDTLNTLLAGLSPQNHALAVQIAALPEEIRGFGHIKMTAVKAARAKRAELLQRYLAGSPETAPERAAA